MPALIFFGDIVEANGKTIRENNLEIKHTIPLNSLVELETGARLFVVSHDRDCDGTPLYSLAYDPCKCAKYLKQMVDRPELEERYPDDFRVINGHFRHCPHKSEDIYDRMKHAHGYSTASLKVIK